MSVANTAAIRSKFCASLRLIGQRVGIYGIALAQTSRLVAKVDSASVQGGFDLISMVHRRCKEGALEARKRDALKRYGLLMMLPFCVAAFSVLASFAK
jgi:hypothetical protein